MRQEIHRKNENNGGSHARKESPAGVTDAERRRDEDHHEACPRQRHAVLQMGRERREQGLGKIRVEVQIIAQLGDAQIFRADIGAAQAVRGLAPVRNRERPGSISVWVMFPVSSYSTTLTASGPRSLIAGR